MSAETPEMERTDRPLQWMWLLLLFSAALAVIYLFLVTNGFGIVGLHYPRPINNNPLQAPIHVIAINGNKLDLADGRVVELENPQLPTSEIQQLLQNSQMLVDVEATAPTFPHEVMISVKQRHFICGTPWARIISVPLFPDDVDANKKGLLGFGSIRSPHPIAPATNQGGSNDGTPYGQTRRSD